jgi:hypothetical protein
MQTGVFFVRLKDNIPSDEQGEALSGRVDRLNNVFDPDTAYPVLAVHFREANTRKQTFYHMPTKTNELEWFSSEYFVFAARS